MLANDFFNTRDSHSDKEGNFGKDKQGSKSTSYGSCGIIKKLIKKIVEIIIIVLNLSTQKCQILESNMMIIGNLNLRWIKYYGLQDI